MLRKIVHIDMDAFFASVEQRDNPALRGQPVAVGGSAERGVVAAASYEARHFGVRSAMASVTAKRRCPQLIFVKPRFEVYKGVSRQIRAIFERYSGLVEPLSLDEAYLDVTEDRQGIGSAIRVAASIRKDILEETGLTASAGISYNKFLAKVASDQNKPNGQFVVLPAEGAAFVASLPARRFYGVGPRTADRMAQLGIHTGADLRAQSLGFLQQHFGKSAMYLYRASRGEDDRPVRPDRVRKSVGGERTYARDMASSAELYAALDEIIEIVWQRVAKQGARGRTLTLKMKYADFRQVTRARSLPLPIHEPGEFEALARSILAGLLPVPLGVRLLGLSLSGFEASAAPTPERVGEPAPAQYPLQF
ncbi:MAG: DNA polymerase IV [Haliea sp.]|nr:DNA polymerase IV [Haliea sp.]